MRRATCGHRTLALRRTDHTPQNIIHQVQIGIRKSSPGNVDSLFLPSAQVDAFLADFCLVSSHQNLQIPLQLTVPKDPLKIGEESQGHENFKKGAKTEWLWWCGPQAQQKHHEKRATTTTTTTTCDNKNMRQQHHHDNSTTTTKNNTKWKISLQFNNDYKKQTQ